MVCVFAAAVALLSESFRLSTAMKWTFALLLAAIFILTLTCVREITKIIQISDEENRDRQKKYRDEMDSFIYTLPAGSTMITVNLSEDKIKSLHGTCEKQIRQKQSENSSAGAFQICRELIFDTLSDQRQRVEIAKILDRVSLLDRLKRGESDIKYTYNVVLEDRSIEIRELSIRLPKNGSAEESDIIIQIKDISDEYYENLVGSYLAKKQFFFTTLVFIKSGRGRSLANNTDMGKENKFYDYDFFLKDIYDKLIDINERDDFFEKMKLSVVRKNLENSNSYAVYVHGIGTDGQKQYIKYEFQFVDDSREAALLSVSNETPVWEIDVLTGINNYKGFQSQALRVLETSAAEDEFSVVVTNIKWFKVINKIFGSARCDRFLCSYAEMLKESALKPLVVGRFPASDHFIMLIKRENLITDEIMRISRQRIETDEREVDVLVTWGIYNVSDKKTAVSDMIEHAIMAFKGIKDVYNIPYAVFSEQEEERYLSGKLVVSGFDKAMREREFQPFYQPIYDAVTHKVVSAEALVRWKKDGSFISPGMFIPALEENGSVSRVDKYISECVTELLSRRKTEGKLVVPVSVNLSAMDFYANEIIEGVMQDIETMVDHDIVPRYEITETAWSDASDNRSEIIESMRSKGTQILIDDFGSGYSSFSTIRDFSFDILKIDMGFVKKIGLSQKADGIVTSIIDMAHFIGLKVVAEGVETKEHLDFLTEHGCDYIQGYYFSKPLPEEEFEKLLDEQE